MATPHLFMKLDKLNMAKTSFKLAASETCGEICAAECPANRQKVLVVTVYVSPNNSSDDWNSLIFSNLDRYSPKVCNMFKILARRYCEDMPIILAGDFNVNVKDN
jgi:exonuclease III